jgi:hypothetical protein
VRNNNTTGHYIQTDFIKVLWDRSENCQGVEKTRKMFKEAYIETCKDYPALENKIAIDDTGIFFEYEPDSLEEIEYLTVRGGLLAMTHTLQELLQFCDALKTTGPDTDNP